MNGDLQNLLLIVLAVAGVVGALWILAHLVQFLFHVLMFLAQAIVVVAGIVGLLMLVFWYVIGHPPLVPWIMAIFNMQGS